MKKVLVVEDDSMLSEIYKKKFEKVGKFEVLIATSGTEAIEKAKKNIPDLILVDLVLPEIDGFEVIEELRKDSSLNKTKIVPFSNLSKEDNRKRLDGLSIDGFIAKSEHTPQELIVEVEKILADTNNKNEKKEDVREVFLNKKGNKERPRILMADGDEFFLDVFGKKLEDSGFDVKSVNGGKETLDLLIKEKFKRVILGASLSDLKTKEIINQFKLNFPKHKTQFVILLDGSESSVELEELKKIGIKGTIDKNKIDPNKFGVGVEKIFS